jgi:multidrug efflux pump subunit AcrA (membrane-fusion protein)
MFLPWTQNIRSTGTITTLKPGQKPQSLNSVIGGQISEWYVQEGDFVKKGDTILKITEVKDAYFDDELLPRTGNQVDFKKNSLVNYDNKLQTQEDLITALTSQRDLKITQSKIKLEQTTLKLQNDSMSLAAAEVNLQTAKNQFQRMDSLYTTGLKSLTDLEAKNVKLQESKAYEVEARNKWLNTKNEMITLQLEISSVSIKFQQDYNKVLSDKYATISAKLDIETELSKLQNQYSNYEYRSGLYFITAPQDGFITKTTSSGIGEIIKEGEQILTLMPTGAQLATEIFIDPIDLPLINIGAEVRLQFDGWPAIVFSGWPDASYGTYGGKIYAIDNYISINGKYRVLVCPDENEHPWPEALRYGSGTNSMILLNDVPIWYELWRKINGFPPEFYAPKEDTKKTDKK